MTDVRRTGTKKSTSAKAGSSKAAKASAAAAADAADTAVVIAESAAVAEAPESNEAKVTIEASPAPRAAETTVGAAADIATDGTGTEGAEDFGPPPEGMFSLEQCVEFVLRAIVQNQEALTIVRKEEPDKVRISVAVAPEDLGKVIGKQGRTINALRTVVKTAAARTNTQVVVDLEGKAV